MTDYSAPWKNLVPLAGWAAILLLVYSLATMAFLIALGGMPETAWEGFALLAENRLAGLLRLDILTILVMPLYYLLFLGLYAGLKAHRSVPVRRQRWQPHCCSQKTLLGVHSAALLLRV
jgi:hypothetical protein